MLILSVSGAPAGSLPWRSSTQAAYRTIVCKATYRLAPLESSLAEDQLALAETDAFEGEPAKKWLKMPSDLVPFKRRVDVMLVGSAFAPQQRPTRRVQTRLVVGSIDKSLEIVADKFLLQDGAPQDGASFTRMPLTYERAAGRPEGENPIGRDTTRDALGRLPLPNVRLPGESDETPGDPASALGYAPHAPSWPSRQRAPGAAAYDPVAEALPVGMEGSYFNAAPPDQQLDALAPDGHIILENLNAEHARLVTRLPGHRAFALLDKSNELHELSCDTLWIDTDAGLLTLTWRKALPVEAFAADERVLVGLEVPGHRITPEALRQLATPDETLTQSQNGAKLSAVAKPPLPFTAALTKPAPAPDSIPEAPDTLSPDDGDLIIEELSTSDPDPDGHTPRSTPEPLRKLPIPRPSVPAPVTLKPPTESRSSTHTPVPPSLVAPSSAAPSRRSPLVASLGFPDIEEQMRAATAAHPLEVTKAEGAPPWLELLFVDDYVAERVLANDKLSPLVDDLSKEAEEYEETLPMHLSDRIVARILARSAPIDAADVAGALRASIDADGFLDPPVVVVEGEIEIALDPLLVLKASLALAEPHAAANKALREQVDAASELLAPGRIPAHAILENATGRVRMAYLSANKTSPANHFQTHVERPLTEARAYATRQVFGTRCVVGTIHTTSGKELALYVADAVRDHLPMLVRFRARALVEVRSRQEPGGNPYVLRCLAAARFGDVE